MRDNNKKHRTPKGVKTINEQQRQKVYYFKDNEILFEDKYGIVRLKEFHNETVSLFSPFTEEDARYIAHMKRATLKVRR